MELLTNENRRQIAHLFHGWEETMIWSYLQGYMGTAWADNIQNPNSAQLMIGDFCFFAGIPDGSLVSNIPKHYQNPCILMIPQNEAWESLIEQCYPNNHKRFKRYAIQKEPDVFDEKKLRGYVEALPKAYRIQKIDEVLYDASKREEWSKDWVSQFACYNDYRRYGIGFAVLYRDELVCGASSYTVYNEGIEIQVDTKAEYRRKGLALACAAKLILACRKRNLYPSWDAAVIESVHLAEKLGYHRATAYTAYEITQNKKFRK